jgi:hypothetical protein
MASHDQVAHRWAQDDAEARTVAGFNLFFERRSNGVQTIFSHGKHFALAAFQDDAHGRRVVLANFSERRSTSTGKHQSIVARAIPSRYPVFDVPYPDSLYSAGGRGHADNLEAIMQRAAEHFAKSKRARTNEDWLTQRAANELAQARDYAAAFDLPMPADSVEELAAEIDRLAKEREAAIKKDRAEREAREKVRMAQLRIDQAPAFEAWLAGAMTQIPSGYSRDEFGGAFLRRLQAPAALDKEPLDILQTSQGASVPWEHAVKAFRFVKACKEAGRSWKRNGATIRVGHFQIDQIDVLGNFWAGCHYIAWPEIERLAKREGVFDLAPSEEAVHHG